MSAACLTVKNLTMAFGDFVIQRDLNFEINPGDIFIIMGGSGCGKSTLLRHLIGLQSPDKGEIYFGEQNLWQAEPEAKQQILQRCGVCFKPEPC